MAMRRTELMSLLSRCRAALTDMTSVSEKKATLDEVNAALKNGIGEPWWVIVLKVLAYAIGLLLAGVGTTTACTMLATSLML